MKKICIISAKYSLHYISKLLDHPQYRIFNYGKGVENEDDNIALGNIINTSTSTDDFHLNQTNGADLEFNENLPQIPSYIRITSMCFCIAIMILGVLGNALVPIVILKSKDMRNSTNVFLMNLSAADLLVLLICTPTVLVEVNTKPETWVLGHEMCKAVPFVELTVAHASVLTILAISFERYYAICEPLKASYVCTKTRALIICLATWTVAGVLTSPMLFIAAYHIDTYVDGSQVAVCLTAVDTFWPAFYYIGSISMFFLLPFIVLLILYSIIVKNLISNSTFAGQSNRQNILKYRKQVMFMLAAVVSSFFICLLPFRALTMWIIIAPTESIEALGAERYYNIIYFCRIMLYLNSAINPILYNLMSSKFRKGFLKILGCVTVSNKGHTFSDRKGTFHTISTNISSSSSGNKFDITRSSKKRDICALNEICISENSPTPKTCRKDRNIDACSNAMCRLDLGFDNIQETDELSENLVHKN